MAVARKNLQASNSAHKQNRTELVHVGAWHSFLQSKRVFLAISDKVLLLYSRKTSMQKTHFNGTKTVIIGFYCIRVMSYIQKIGFYCLLHTRMQSFVMKISRLPRISFPKYERSSATSTILQRHPEISRDLSRLNMFFWRFKISASEERSRMIQNRRE